MDCVLGKDNPLYNIFKSQNNKASEAASLTRKISPELFNSP